MDQLSNRDKRAIIYFLFSCGHRATAIHRIWSEKSSIPVPSKSFIFKWVRHFRTGHESLEEGERSGRPGLEIRTLYADRIPEWIEEEPKITTKELAQRCGCAMTTIRNALTDELGYRMLQRQWVPHVLTESQKQDRILFCQEQLAKYNNGASKAVYNMVTCDESWVHIFQPKVGPQAKVWVSEDVEQIVQPRQNISTKKFMVTVFFSKAGILFTKVKDSNETISAEYYTKKCLRPMVIEWKNDIPGHRFRIWSFITIMLDLTPQSTPRTTLT